MANARRFAHYPAAKETADFNYTFAEDTNPPLRGLPLVVASNLVTSFSFIPRYLFSNAGFTKLKLIPGLGEVSWRPQSLVIPVSDSVDSSTEPLELDGSLTEPQPSDVAWRFLSVADYHELYRSRQVTPVQVVEALLPLITDRAKSEHAIAWSDVSREDALYQAQKSAERWSSGMPLSVLDGVPIGVKSDIDTNNYISTIGMKPNDRFRFFKTYPDDSAWYVRKLQQAGAIVIGKMTMHELGLDTSGCNPRVGTPINCYNKSYFPGGSSSGGGSALGGGIIPIAVGSDAGGSVRVPACFNGVYGLKTTYGRLIYPHSSACVTGPMAGTAEDLTIAYRFMAQKDPSHGIASQFSRSQPPEPSEKKYIGVCMPWIKAKSTPDVLDAYNKAIEYLTSKLGYETVDIDLPFLQEGQRALSAMLLAESVEKARSRAEDKPDEWLSLANHPNRILLSVGEQASALDYLRCSQIREKIMQHLAFLFQKYPGLVIVTPTTPMAGWPSHPGDQQYGFTDGNATMLCMFYIWLSNISGCPSVNSPMGYADPKQGEGKMPMGIMAMGEWGEEERLLLFARHMAQYLREGYAGGRLRPKEWVDVIALAKKHAEAHPSNGAQVVD